MISKETGGRERKNNQESWVKELTPQKTQVKEARTEHPFGQLTPGSVNECDNAGAPSIQAERAGLLLPSMFSPGAEAIDDRELQWRDQSACDTVLAALWYVHLSGHMVGDDPSWPMMSAYPLRLRSPQKCTEMQIMGFPVVVIDQTDPGKERQVEHCGMIHVCKVTRLRHGKWRRKWLPTPVLLPGEFHGQRSLLGYSPWGRKE